MTYAGFLALFLAAPLLALGLFLRRRLLNRRFLAVTALMVVIALVFMTPWDHTAAVWGLWTWADGRTWGVRVWMVPPEEYLFCALEALLAATLTFVALTWRRRRPVESAPRAGVEEVGQP